MSIYLKHIGKLEDSGDLIYKLIRDTFMFLICGSTQWQQPCSAEGNDWNYSDYKVYDPSKKHIASWVANGLWFSSLLGQSKFRLEILEPGTIMRAPAIAFPRIRRLKLRMKVLESLHDQIYIYAFVYFFTAYHRSYNTGTSNLRKCVAPPPSTAACHCNKLVSWLLLNWVYVRHALLQQSSPLVWGEECNIMPLCYIIWFLRWRMQHYAIILYSVTST